MNHAAEYRPKLHFSAPNGWINDPNGMIYVEGVYHLFYQFYPGHTHWGPMHWGHATSRDLIHWEDLGVALAPDEAGTIYSGSAYLDRDNISGFGTKDKPAMILAYTAHKKDPQMETQCIAYSTDYVHFTKYEGNPVIPGVEGRNARDPKLFYNPVKKCVGLVLATEECVTFYASKDFKTWEKTGTFTAGEHGLSGTCECPDLFPIETAEGTKYVLIISTIVPKPAPGEEIHTGNRTNHVNQYYIGDFDGNTFIDTEKADTALYLDYGPDYYAAVTFHGTNKPLLVGWADNWEYANESPCGHEGFQGKMAFARKLSLVKTEAGYRLASVPMGLESCFAESTTVLAGESAEFGDAVLVRVKGARTGEIRFSNESGEFLQVRFTKTQIIVDRSPLDVWGFNQGFDEDRLRRIATPWERDGDTQVILDGCVLEIYADGGRTCITVNVYPKNALERVEILGSIEARVHNVLESAIPTVSRDCYPHVHFAPRFGWLNDPNGMVYHDGIYELYFQHNPEGDEWANMTWGHARSTDLLHWEELDPVLYPDETGTMFSGSAIRNDRGDAGYPKDAILYYYTAAKFTEKPKFAADFTIRLAHSLDGGRTIIKDGCEVLEQQGSDNRDPKVFWHEESKAYILVLWITGDEFGIFRSENAKCFVLSEKVTLPGGFECPDLFCLPVVTETGEKTGEEKWVFWAADGSYYVGSFDGWHFVQEQRRMRAYGDTPYAAQTFSGYPGDKVVSIAWLRTYSICRQTTGAMSLPRELSLVKTPMGYLLKQDLPAEMPAPTDGFTLQANAKHSIYDRCMKINVSFKDRFLLTIRGVGKKDLDIAYNPQSGNLIFTLGNVSRFVRCGRGLETCEIIYDRGIVEIGVRNNLRFEIIDFPSLRTVVMESVEMKSGDASAEVAYLG